MSGFREGERVSWGGGRLNTDEVYGHVTRADEGRTEVKWADGSGPTWHPTKSLETSTEEAAREVLARWDDLPRPDGWNTGDEHHLACTVIEALRAVVQSPTDEDGEWTATLEALIAEVYGILKPLATTGTHASGSPILQAYELLNAQDFEAALAARRVSVPPTEDWEYGVRHVSVDGWLTYRAHASRESAERDLDTCGMNCEIVRRPRPWLPVPTEEKNP